MEIKYEIQGDWLPPPCPNGKKSERDNRLIIHVNSRSCTKCEYFKSKQPNNTIVCNFKKEEPKMTNQEITKQCAEIMATAEYDENGNCTNIEYLDIYKEWSCTCRPSWNWDSFDYRIKPKPTYRAFKDGKEFFPHKYRWVKRKGEDGLYQISNIYPKGACLLKDDDRVTWLTYDELFSDYDFAIDYDTTEPCGVKE